VQELGASPATLLTGLGVDEYLTRADAAGTRTLLTDALGSIVALTDPAGAVQNEYTYEPFGAATETGSDTNPFQYTGRENDGTGLYYYRARSLSYHHRTSASQNLKWFQSFRISSRRGRLGGRCGYTRLSRASTICLEAAMRAVSWV